MRTESMSLSAGPFSVSLTTDVAEVAAGVRQLYPPALLRGNDGFVDFNVVVRRGHGARRWIRPQAIFEFDHQQPFKPLPLDQALPMFEWGLNYLIAGSAHWYLIVHGAAVERNGGVAILPGTPGSGKSTLAAGLVNRGWRLLSDELALIRRSDGAVVPLARPISLKNQSIDLMRRFAPGGVFSPVVDDTIKGSVALLRAPDESVERIAEVAPPRWIVFPLWRPEGGAVLEPVSKAQAFMTVSRNAVNYGILGASGFGLLADAIDRCECFRFAYHSLDEAVGVFDALASGQAWTMVPC